MVRAKMKLTHGGLPRSVRMPMRGKQTLRNFTVFAASFWNKVLYDFEHVSSGNAGARARHCQSRPLKKRKTFFAMFHFYL